MTFNDILRRLFGTAEEALQRRARNVAPGVGQDRVGLNWREDIVDLLRLLDLDSSVEARRELARDLGVEYDENSAGSNRRLHAAVMDRLRAYGERL